MGIPGAGLIKPVVKPLKPVVKPLAKPLKPLAKPLAPLVKGLGGSSHHKKKTPTAAPPMFEHRKNLLAGTRKGGSDHGNNDNNSNVRRTASLRDKSAHSTKSHASSDSSYIEEIIESDDDEFAGDEFYEDSSKVRFDEFDEMYDVLHIEDYSKSEVKKTWYEKSDYNRMVEESRKIAQKMEEHIKKVGTTLQDKYEPRGLESWTTVGQTRSKELKLAAMDAVWNEQMRQWNKDRVNPEQIRVEYFKACRESQVEAEQRGFSDELVAREIRREDEVQKKIKSRQRLIKQSKAIIGTTVKKTTKTTGTVLKATGKGVIATGKIGYKSTKAVATLDRKGLVKAIKNKPKKKKEDFVEGHNYKQKSQHSQDVEEHQLRRAASKRGDSNEEKEEEEESDLKPLSRSVEQPISEYPGHNNNGDYDDNDYDDDDDDDDDDNSEEEDKSSRKKDKKRSKKDKRRDKDAKKEKQKQEKKEKKAAKKEAKKEKKKEKHAHRPEWEKAMIKSGKY